MAATLNKEYLESIASKISAEFVAVTLLLFLIGVTYLVVKTYLFKSINSKDKDDEMLLSQEDIDYLTIVKNNTKKNKYIPIKLNEEKSDLSCTTITKKSMNVKFCLNSNESNKIEEKSLKVKEIRSILKVKGEKSYSRNLKDSYYNSDSCCSMLEFDNRKHIGDLICIPNEDNERLHLLA